MDLFFVVESHPQCLPPDFSKSVARYIQVRVSFVAVWVWWIEIIFPATHACQSRWEFPYAK